MTTQNFTNQKYNSLTFIQATDLKVRDQIVWELQCDCGNKIMKPAQPITSFTIRDCGCGLSKHVARKNRRYHPFISSAKSVWFNYNDGCDFDTFLILSQLPCFYCGILPHRIYNVYNSTTFKSKNQHQSEYQKLEGNFIYNGLDRVDSSKDHSPDNVVPCCYECNWAKNDMSLDEFIEHIISIYEHTRKCEF